MWRRTCLLATQGHLVAQVRTVDSAGTLPRCCARWACHPRRRCWCHSQKRHTIVRSAHAHLQGRTEAEHSAALQRQVWKSSGRHAHLQGAVQAGEGLQSDEVEQHDARAAVVAAVVEGRDVGVCKAVVALLEELRQLGRRERAGWVRSMRGSGGLQQSRRASLLLRRPPCAGAAAVNPEQQRCWKNCGSCWQASGPRAGELLGRM